MADFPNRINELRRAANVTQDALAHRLNTTKITISRLERGLMELTVNWMRRVAHALDCAPADLLIDADVPDRLRDGEAELIEAYRRADPGERASIRRVAETLVEYRGPPTDHDQPLSRTG